ncbi:DUF551 domain-containing protein [Raoultella ornithinolytica]|uniref:DUF551 domain-containing protein n=1 Tax=Raoultella ornithinolytica TaxID=54291 RepID=A0A9Q9JJ82_RAOOR|nr:DUF551 domain-containing protein [Raoultella ornithinolytica]UXE39470.1 DUF551 domain-containing protein [Raoultella ornithinolytica]
MTSKLTITDERVISVIERLEHYACNLKWTNVRGAQDLLTAADGLRELQERRKAAMDSEPVFILEVARADYKGQKLGNHFGFITLDAARELKEGNYQLYRHAQPAPAVQCPFPCGWDNLNKLAIQDAAFVTLALVAGEPATESIRQAAISNNDRLLKVISACRAAMLAAADCSIPMISDRWVPVSERLPEDSGRYWCYVEEQNDLGKSHYQWNCSWNGDRWWVEREGGGIVTHWMPLTAAPREVSNEK